MKKIYYLLAFVALAFTACQKEPLLQSSVPLSTKQALSITLQTSDYSKLSSGYPKSTFTFDNITDANTYIPKILNSEYVTAANGSTAKVTYTVSSLYFKLADSASTDVAYTLTPADYLLLPGNKYTDFSISQVLQWLPYKYPTPVNNQLALLSFTPYPATLTPPYSFLYLNGAWRQIYTITPAQYTTAGEGKYDQFTTSNTEASLVSTFGFFLKNDFTIMDTIRKNDLVFVSFGYYNSGNYQRVRPLEFDGNSFVLPYTSTGIATFVKANGAWTPEPVVAYSLTSADLTIIEAGAAGSAAAKTNLTTYGDFSNAWATADMDAAVIECLPTDIKSPQQNTLYQITFQNYNSPAPNPLNFIWDGTKWVAQQ
jgi:hypothetical protein